jgi:hypothetical protein
MFSPLQDKMNLIIIKEFIANFLYLFQTKHIGHYLNDYC